MEAVQHQSLVARAVDAMEHVLRHRLVIGPFASNVILPFSDPDGGPKFTFCFSLVELFWPLSISPIVRPLAFGMKTL